MNHEQLSAALRALRCIEAETIAAAGIPISGDDEILLARDPGLFYLKACDERQKALFRLIASRCRNIQVSDDEEAPTTIPLVAEILVKVDTAPLDRLDQLADPTEVRRTRNRPFAERGDRLREFDRLRSL